MDEFDRKILENIQQHGCSVIHIAEEDELPPFAYSVGIEKTSSAPEAIVIGHKQTIAHFIINEYNLRIQKGEVFEIGQRYSDFIEGFEVQIEAVDQSFYDEYFGYNLWLYQGPEFRVIQIVYPNTSGIWPWQSEANNWFKERQPILIKHSSFPPAAKASSICISTNPEQNNHG